MPGGAARRALTHPLAILLTFAFVQALTWTLVTPAFQGPDEDAHFAYVQTLVEQHELPSSSNPGSPYSTEFVVASTWADLVPTRGDPQARTAWSAAEEAHWQAHEKTLQPSQRADGTGLNPAAQNPPLYYAYAAVPYSLGLHTSRASFFTRLQLMRLASIPLYLATIAFVWLLAFEVLGRRWSATLAASVVALQPEFGFLSATINPDAALAAEWSGFMYFAVRILTAGPQRAPTLGLAACAIAALFTQARSLPLCPLALAVLFLAPKVSKRERLSVVAAGVAITAGAVGCLAYIREHALAGSVAQAPPGSFHIGEFVSYVWQFYLPRLPGMSPMIGPDYGAETAWVNRFFGNLGWLEIEFPGWVNVLLRWGTVALLVALATGLVLRWDAVRRNWRVAGVLVATVLLELLALHVVAYEALLINPGDPILTGRYLFPLISIWGLALAAVLTLLPARLRAPLAVGLVGAAAMLDVFAFELAIRRFYA